MVSRQSYKTSLQEKMLVCWDTEHRVFSLRTCLCCEVKPERTSSGQTWVWVWSGLSEIQSMQTLISCEKDQRLQPKRFRFSPAGPYSDPPAAVNPPPVVKSSCRLPSSADPEAALFSRSFQKAGVSAEHQQTVNHMQRAALTFSTHTHTHTHELCTCIRGGRAQKLMNTLQCWYWQMKKPDN